MPLCFFVSVISTKCFRRMPSRPPNSCRLHSHHEINPAKLRSPSLRCSVSRRHQITSRNFSVRVGTVALCEQVEDPKLAKGLVRREVVRLYTPGTLIDSEFLPSSESNVLTAVATRLRSVSTGRKELSFGRATLEVSTGEYWISEFHGAQAQTALLDELARLEPKELLFSEDSYRRSCVG